MDDQLWVKNSHHILDYNEYKVNNETATLICLSYHISYHMIISICEALLIIRIFTNNHLVDSPQKIATNQKLSIDDDNVIFFRELL